MTIYTFLLDGNWGAGRLVAADSSAATVKAAGARSHDHTGMTLLWQPGDIANNAVGVACDLEQVERMSVSTAQLWGMQPREFTPAWLSTEVICKLYDVPVLYWLRRWGLILPHLIAGEAVIVMNQYRQDDYVRLRCETWPDWQRQAMFGVRLSLAATRD